MNLSVQSSACFLKINMLAMTASLVLSMVAKEGEGEIQWTQQR
jgi:hypothetical protein